MEFINSIAGEWTGTGVGVFPPTVSEFHYSETLVIKETAKPNLWEIKSVTKSIPSGKPMHVEVGFIRAFPQSASMVISHPFGLAEISVATESSSKSIQFNAGSLGQVGSINRTPCSKSPHTTHIRRTYIFENDKLSFAMDMATSTHPELQNHLIAKYVRSTSLTLC